MSKLPPIHLPVGPSIGIAILLLLYLQSCSQHRYEDFSPEEIVNVPATRLEGYVDTASTLARIEGYSNERKKVDSLLYFAEALRNYDEDVAQLYAQMAYDIATEKNWKFPRAISAHRLAVLKESKAKYSEDIEDALVDANISKRIFEQTDRSDWKIWNYSIIGRLHYRKNNRDSAQLYFKWALEQLEETSIDNSQSIRGGILHDLANTYRPQDPDTFLFYAAQSDSLYQLEDSKIEQALLWIDLSQFYIGQGKHAEADSLLQLSLDYSLQNEVIDIQVLTYQARGYLSAIKYYYSREEKHSANALNDFRACLNLQNEGQYNTHSQMGWLFSTRWVYLDNGSDADSTLFYCKKAIEGARQEGALNALKTSSDIVAHLCSFENERQLQRCTEVLGEEPVAFLKNSYGEAVENITRHSKAAYQRTNRVEQREIIVSATRKRQIILLSAAVLFIIAGLIFLLILQQVRQKRLQARMEALRAQINPHFFSNSLNAIENLVNMDKKKEASKYIIHFSRLSRQVLNRSRDPMTSLEEELNMMQHFLQLEKLRFQDKLDFEIITAPDLDTRMIEVPGLILQPYAENAIWHGIKPKSEAGHLRIAIKKEKKSLICIIEDNGIGRKKSRELKAALAKQRASMGMKITEERIQTMGKVKGQSVEIIDLEDENGTALGTRVILRIPLRYRAKEKAV